MIYSESCVTFYDTLAALFFSALFIPLLLCDVLNNYFFFLSTLSFLVTEVGIIPLSIGN